MKGLTALLVVLSIGCGLEDSHYKKTGSNTASMAITNAEGEEGVLRTGTALNMSAGPDVGLKPSHMYQVLITNATTQKELAKADLLADELGTIPLATVAHDIGEFDDVKDDHNLQVQILSEGKSLADMTLPVLPHMSFAGHGFKVDEVQPPHVFSADATGKPLNAVEIGGPADPGEVAAPIYVGGEGFPANVTTVDVYVMKDRDSWQGATLPQKPGQDGLVYGPVTAKVVNGVL